MNILAIWAAHNAAPVPGLAIGMPAGVQVGGLDGFAAGALLAGACFLAAARPARRWRVMFAWRALLRLRAAPTRRRPAGRPERAAAASGAHRSPPRWARTGRPRAEVRRVLPRHAAPQAGLASRMTGLLPGRAMAGAALPGRRA
jgi:hypothetical protein